MSDAVEDIQIPIRGAVLGDRGYVLDAWYRSLEAEHLAEVRKRFRARVSGQALRSKILVACDPDDRDTLLGFAVLEGTKLHYVYVRKSVQRLGIARKLLTSAPIETYSTTTSDFRSRIKPDERGWKHDKETTE